MHYPWLVVLVVPFPLPTSRRAPFDGLRLRLVTSLLAARHPQCHKTRFLGRGQQSAQLSICEGRFGRVSLGRPLRSHRTWHCSPRRTSRNSLTQASAGGQRVGLSRGQLFRRDADDDTNRQRCQSVNLRGRRERKRRCEGSELKGTIAR